MFPTDQSHQLFRSLGLMPPQQKCPAEMVMNSLNPNAVIERQGDEFVIVEDWVDSVEDGNIFRLAYFTTPDALHAQAYCLENPFDPSRPNGGYAYSKCHCHEDGNICIGHKKHRGKVKASAYTLEEAVRKARYWCTGFSHLHETGKFPQPGGGEVGLPSLHLHGVFQSSPAHRARNGVFTKGTLPGVRLLGQATARSRRPPLRSV